MALSPPVHRTQGRTNTHANARTASLDEAALKQGSDGAILPFDEDLAALRRGRARGAEGVLGEGGPLAGRGRPWRTEFARGSVRL